MYQKSQFGKVIVIPLAAALIIAIFLETFQYNSITILVLAIFLLVLLLFYKLTVIVNNEHIKLIFGIGLIRKKFSLKDINSCQVVRNKWWYGFGIRLFPGGWLFNVSGLDAVEILMKNGKKYRIGTEEPKVLQRTIQTSLS
ncbi:hypothetical protein CL617_05785 [archaeon]|nr:hypothetical protein [archaeon]|tara:strand:- start:5878 stop:6300 length:423 start_codon:yes stop_codon:yes gene_type:complete